MHTVERLNQALQQARQMGFAIRSEWLTGGGSGDCEIRGQRTLFLDLADSPAEQLEAVLAVLNRVPRLDEESIPSPLRQMARKAG